MSSGRTQLAKLTSPRLTGALERKRLFEHLDAGRARRLIWIAGPPGAGKTTAVSSWLANRGIRALWFQVDAGDADLATFFLYLKQAAQVLSKQGRALPQLARESQADIRVFSRRFFRELYEALPTESVLVFDNLQDAVGPGVVSAVTDAVEEAPPGCAVIAISREQPPALCARLLATEAMMVLDSSALRLTKAETSALITLRSDVSDEVAAWVHERADGWAAGVALIIESLVRSESLDANLDLSVREALFGYFADQVFERASKSVQQVLLATSIFSSFDADMAKRMSGVPDARRVLDDLCRRRLFTDRRGTSPYSYQYHALFREYLLDRIAGDLSVEQRRALEQQGALLLRELGRCDEAFGLSCKAQDWPTAVTLIKGNAETMLDQGRWRTVLDWINLLPSEHAAHDPWVQYWRGLALVANDLGTSRWVLEHTCVAFQQSADRIGICLSAAGLIDTYYYEYADFRPADRWIDLLCTTLDEELAFPSHSAELQAYGAAAMGLLFRRPGDAMLVPCVDRIQVLLDSVHNMNRRVATALHLLTYCSWVADFARAAHIAPALETLAERPDVSEINRYHCLDWLSFFYTVQGDNERGDQLNAKARAVAQRSGDKTLQLDLLLTQVFLADHRDDIRASRRAIDEITALGANRPFDRCLQDMARTQSRLTCADFEGAVHAGHAVAASADAIGIPYWRGMGRLRLAQALIELRRYDEARRVVDAGLEIVGDTCLAQPFLLLTAMSALSHLRQGHEVQTREALQRLFAFAREDERAALFTRIRRHMSELCAAALEREIESEYVRQLVRQSDWPAPSTQIKAWPWPIRVHTLGQFGIEIDGEPVEFEGKAPRRVLALLKVLVAMGGQRVPRRQLIDALWKEQDGDAADAALNVAVVRLRKLLGRSDALLVSNEEFTLNRRLFWSDAWAFERTDFGAIPATLAFQRLIDVYPGDFLPGDSGEAWSIRPRLRLRTRFILEATVLGRELEQAGRLELALDLYTRSLLVDDLAEEFYQGQMRCHLVLGTSAEGMAVFRRLRQVLSVVLGIAPSADSEALARRLVASRPARPDDDVDRSSTAAGPAAQPVSKSVHRP